MFSFGAYYSPFTDKGWTEEKTLKKGLSDALELAKEDVLFLE